MVFKTPCFAQWQPPFGGFHGHGARGVPEPSQAEERQPLRPQKLQRGQRQDAETHVVQLHVPTLLGCPAARLRGLGGVDGCRWLGGGSLGFLGGDVCLGWFLGLFKFLWLMKPCWWHHLAFCSSPALGQWQMPSLTEDGGMASSIEIHLKAGMLAAELKILGALSQEIRAIPPNQTHWRRTPWGDS